MPPGALDAVEGFTNDDTRFDRIVKLVRAMRKGWLKRQDEKPPAKPPVYLLWQDDAMAANHTQAGELGSACCDAAS